MQTEYCKEREGLLSPRQTTPWWNGSGSQPLTLDSLAGNTSESFAGVKAATTPETEQGVDKQSSATFFTFSNVGGKISRDDVSKPHDAFAMQSACFEFGFAQPKIYTENPHLEQYYGVVSAYESQMSTGRVMLPLKLETEEYGTVYVNSKQYHGIIRRRQSRAKAILESKPSRCRKQPYIHHSRHLHAMRRPRGSSGRFLNTKKTDAAKQSSSKSCDVFHPQNGTMNSSSESNRPNISRSEVTNMDEYLSSSVHSLGGMVMSGKWISAATDIGCCNLKT